MRSSHNLRPTLTHFLDDLIPAQRRMISVVLPTATKQFIPLRLR